MTRPSVMESIQAGGVDTCSPSRIHDPCSAACGENQIRLALPAVMPPDPYMKAVASGCGGSDGGGALTCDARENLQEQQLVCARDTQGGGDVMP
ncbi:MAG: hypothetical protein HY898_09615 [Deltaproteobacteria bacterium]|nr:hypothetical protein [Deltaproteobacteria bacterium]